MHTNWIVKTFLLVSLLFGSLIGGCSVDPGRAETCQPATACNAHGTMLRLCTTLDTLACNYVASDGPVFPCASCGDCQAAAGQAARWCQRGAALDASAGDHGDLGGPQGDCVTSTPCAADSDCVALAGTRCNSALSAPRCQVVHCGTAGSECSAPALCATELTCVDPASFGTNKLSLQGNCKTIPEAQALCLTRCQQTPPPNPDPSIRCTASQKAKICQYACNKYPTDWKQDCVQTFSNSLNGFSFRFLSCAGPTACQLEIDCTNFEFFSLNGSCS